MQTMVAPIEEDLPTMTMPDCCLEPVYNWNFICLPRKKRVKRVGMSVELGFLGDFVLLSLKISLYHEKLFKFSLKS